MYFNFTEKLVLTAMVGFFLALIAGMGFDLMGVADVAKMCITTSLVSFAVGVVIGAVALLKHLWFSE